MSFKKSLKVIDENQQKIAEYGKFDNEILKKINYKLRLDWNYYSNRMEGGTLTKAETRSVMVGNIHVKDKPFKDVAEMTGHDKIIIEVLKMSKGETRIAEKRIKDIHKVIMYEEDEGKSSQIGQWKKEPNEIIGYKNEKIAFTRPSEVADEVHKLLNHTNAELDKIFSGKDSIHPVKLAAQFHIDFVSIHPFYDGNGRTSRILTNIILMSCGYPVIIIKDEQKQSYYKLLGDIQAYGGNTDLFYSFISERVIETQELILDALQGKGVEEQDDIDKEIALFKSSLMKSEGEIKEKNDFLIAELFQTNLNMLFELFILKNQKFADLFLSTQVINQINNRFNSASNLEYFDRWTKLQFEIQAINNTFLDEKSRTSKIMNLLQINSDFKGFDSVSEMKLQIHFKGFNQNDKNVFDEYTELILRFDQYKYGISDSTRQLDKRYEKFYTEVFSEEEITKIVNEKVKEFLDKLKNRTTRITSL